MINVQPTEEPSRKRSLTSTENPALHSNSYRLCERSSNLKKTDMADHSNGEEVLTCQLTVPLWVLDYQGDFFLHLVGAKNNGMRGYKTKRIYAETDCKVQISRFSKKAGEPMRITIRSGHKYHGPVLRINMEKAITMVEDYIQDYIEEDGAHGRLRFELRAGSLANSLLYRAESGAVQINNDYWIQLLELPCIRNGGITNPGSKVRLNHNLQKRIWDCTECSAEIFADCPDMPLKTCKPYALIHGSELKQVERATAMITNTRHDPSYLAE